MLSDEEKEIFKNLKEYMQNNINNGYHKFVYNDLDWDFKCIDCINAIDKVLKQSKEIEELKDTNKKLYEMGKQNAIQELINNDYIRKDKIKAKIEEYDDKGMTVNLVNRSVGKTFQQAVHYEVKKVLQSLLEKE